MSNEHWLRDLDVQLGPIVGFTDATSTRIWVRAGSGSDDLVLRHAPATVEPTYDPSTGAFGPVQCHGAPTVTPMPIAGPYNAGQVVLSGLEPDRAYFYEVVDRARPVGSNGFASPHPLRFRTMPEVVTDRLRFAFWSCNGLSDPPKGLSPTAMWDHLGPVALGDPTLRFAILGGDQIYADPIRKNWLAEHDADVDLDPEQRVELRQELERAYARMYVAWWRRPAIRGVMAQLPCIMTWDDHDIYDGWGSQGDEDLPAQQVFFEAAAHAADAHQFVHVGLAPRRAPHDHQAFDFTIGKVGFVVLDLRTCRNIKSTCKYALMGDAQWAWFKATLARLGEAGIEQLVLITSVPPVFADRWVSRLPRFIVRDMRDDLLDEWASPPNRNDQLRLLGTLFAFRAQYGANVLVLGGDVHMAAVGGIRTRSSKFLRPGESEAMVHQGVSSAIAYRSMSGFGSSIVEHHIEGDHELSSEFTGFIKDVMRTRNYSIVEANLEDREFDFELHLEGEARPYHYRFPGLR